MMQGQEGLDLASTDSLFHPKNSFFWAEYRAQKRELPVLQKQYQLK